MYFKRFLIIAMILLSACAKKHLIDLTGEEYFALGVEYLEKKDYTEAQVAFEHALLYSETPELARNSQYSIALSKMLYADTLWFSAQTEWLDAIASYEAFAEYYVDDLLLSECYFRLGMMYAEISTHPKTDQTFTQNSVENFVKLKMFYPEIYEHMQAEKTHKKMLEKLAEHEYQVAQFYFRTNASDSAATRILYMLKNYPSSTREETALEQLTEYAIKKDDKSLALTYYGELKEKFPKNKTSFTFKDGEPLN